MKTKPNPLEVGKRIKKIRIKLGLSMDEFAVKIDEKAKSGTVSNWETGKNLPNNERLKKIAELGNVTVEYLLSGNPFDNLTPEEQEEYIDALIEAEEFDRYLKREYPQLEDFLELGSTFYVNKYKLTESDKELLYKVALALFGDKEPNYPSQEVLEKEYTNYKDSIKHIEKLQNDKKWINE